MSRSASALLAAWSVAVALAASGDTAGSPAGGSGSRATPKPAARVNAALRAARAKQSVRFRLDLVATATLDERRLRGDEKDPILAPRLVRALAAHPFRVSATGLRTRRALWALGRLHYAGTTTAFELVLAGRTLFLKLNGVWYRDTDLTPQALVRTELLGGIVPEEACARKSAGCDRVDFAPSVRRGRLGRLFKGGLIESRRTWTASGRLDADQFTRFNTGTSPERRDTRSLYHAYLQTYAPYERLSRLLVAGTSRDTLPRRFEFSYDLDQPALRQHLRGQAETDPAVTRSAEVRIDLSDWGTKASVSVPRGARPLGGNRARSLFYSLLRALYVFL